MHRRRPRSESPPAHALPWLLGALSLVLSAASGASSPPGVAGAAPSQPAPTPSAPATAPSGEPPVTALGPFEASYSWYWRGMRVAVSTMTLEHKSDDTWVYSSAASPRGIGRLYPMRPRLQSVMRILPQGVVEPLSFHATGSGPSHDANLSFNWQDGRVQGVYEGAPVDFPIKPGVQDDLSVQIAMLLDLELGRMPDAAMEVNKDSVREYDYQRDGTAELNSGVGPVSTIIYIAHHPGSPRYTRFWCAPSLGYIPVQVQQTNRGAVEWTMRIRTLRRS